MMYSTADQADATQSMSPGFALDITRAYAIMLTTFRRDGEPVGTPVWFVVRDGRLYARTVENSGKVKRIRGLHRVEVAPCTQRGQLTGVPRSATAHVLNDNEAGNVAPMFHRRYPLLARLFEAINRIQGHTQVYLAIEQV